MSRCCLIFGGGDPVGRETVFRERCGDELLIAADKGYLLMQELDLYPDLIIGDFDSAPEPEHENKRVYPPEKDDTDLMLAIKAGLEQGADCFKIFGATGGRLDHTYAAITALAYLLDHGASGIVISDNERIMMIDRGKHIIPAVPEHTLSLFAYSADVKGLCISGAKYKANGITLKASFPLGVSNEFEGENAEIGFDEGRLLVICSRQ